ncbi:MAG: DUF2817 domain-containing protein [Alphaproteobacteria bacterium]|nr:DUF2817 domain-containing protein [Alphaproteobacteria bacterium]
MGFFHDSYAEARRAFRGAAGQAGFDLHTLDYGLPGPDGKDLSIDVAVRSKGILRRAVVISSGTHGVEGYFGSAVQLDQLSGRLAGWEPQAGEGVVLIHAVNPWGMAFQRRVNEDNVDQNRNFRKAGEAWSGAAANYALLDGLLNPASPPTRFDPFPLQALPALLRHGFTALKEAVASGQYDYPKGLFYGGAGPSRSHTLLKSHLPRLMGSVEQVVHLDLHTGSGRWGTYVLAADMPADGPDARRLRGAFGDEAVEAFDPTGVLYTIHGALGPWMQELFPGVRYDCLLAEFGTYPNLSVLTTCRYENRVVQHAPDDAALRRVARAKMMEAFCPADATWRASCVAQADAVMGQAMAHVFGGGEA